MRDWAVEGRLCRNVLERWLLRNRCENFLQLMVTCTEQGLQPASPSQPGQVCCKSHLLCGRRSGMPGVGGGMGGMWDLLDMLGCKQSKPELYSLARCTNREILMLPRFEDGWRKGTTAVCAPGCCSGRHSNLACLEFGGSLKQELWCEHPNFCPSTVESLCPLKSGHEEVAQCV